MFNYAQWHRKLTGQKYLVATTERKVIVIVLRNERVRLSCHGKFYNEPVTFDS
jgi:hypothetical protein